MPPPDDAPMPQASLAEGDRPQKAELYPEQGHAVIRELPGLADSFDLLREQLLLGYGYHTARSYWGDLEHWRDWCWRQEPVTEPLDARGSDIQDYLDFLGALDYSPNTRARRLTALRAFYLLAVQNQIVTENPCSSVLPIPRRK